MSSVDIGIDLGTANIIISTNKGIALNEPSIVAYNKKTERVLAVGNEAYDMLGKTPDYIVAVKPLRDGVISDHDMADCMISEFIKKANGKQALKPFMPRIIMCVPSMVTDVESRAVMEAAINVGARKVFLIEEPVAALLGTGIDILEPTGRMVVDIGGGTTDCAVISMGGIVKSKSIKVAGNKIDEAIIKYIANKYKILIGDKMAENAKYKLANVLDPTGNKKMLIKGRNMFKGLPEQIEISDIDINEAIMDIINLIIDCIKDVLEVTPPELVGDIYTNGITLTGGGALIYGIDKLIEDRLKSKCLIADDPLECVAKGTMLAFKYTDKLLEGFKKVSFYKEK